MKALIKTTVAIGISEVAIVCVVILKNKYLAISIGREGFGIYGLLLSFFNLAIVFSGTWLATGATKYTAEFGKEGDYETVCKISAFSIWLATAIATIMAMVFILAESLIRSVFLTESVLRTYFVLFSLAYIGMSLRPVFIALLKGLREVRRIVFARIAISLVEIGLAVAFIYMFELNGFFLSIFISSIIAVLLLATQLRKRIGKIFLMPSLREQISVRLLTFGGVNLCLALVNLGSQYFQRLIVVKQMDLSSVGLFQIAVALMGYLVLASRGSEFYFYPKMSERLEPARRNFEINSYLRFVLMITIPICVTALLFRSKIILLLTSSEFLPLTSVFVWFVVAALITVINGAFQSTIVGMAKLKVHSLSTIVTHCLWVVFPLILIRRHGIGSLGMGFVAGGATALLINIVFLRRHIGLRLFLRTASLLGIAAATLTVSVVLQNVFWGWRLCWVVVTTILVIVTVKPQEWAKIYRYAVRHLVKNKY